MLNKVLEALAIRLGWIAWALQIKPKPGLCPPECNEAHTYLWPCRARIKRPKVSTRGAHYDRLGPMPDNYGPEVHDPLLDETRIEEP